MSIVRPLLLLVLTLALTGCGSESSQPPAPPPPVKDTAFGDMAGAMDKARGVEATTMQQKEELDRAVQQAESH
ncbi:MAG: hypothetical protein ABW106_13785 [Steroidobacteraceae bacterium]